jgi:hypothetical protein
VLQQQMLCFGLIAAGLTQPRCALLLPGCSTLALLPVLALHLQYMVSASPATS